MPDGATHEAVGLSLLALLAGGAALAKAGGALCGVSWPQIGAFAAGLSLGLLAGPDLDQEQITREEARWKRIPLLGGLLFLVMVALWMPYGLLLKHRSPLSHTPLLGTALRAAYLGLWLALLQALTRWAVGDWLRALPPVLWGPGLLGWAAQDTAHWLADRWGSA